MANTRFTRKTTDGLDEATARTYWEDLMRENFFALEFDFPNEINFRANVEFSNIGPGKVADFALSPHQTRRLPHHIARDGVDSFVLSFVAKGGAELSCKSGNIEWRPGDVILYEAGAPFCLKLNCYTVLRKIFFDGPWLHTMIPNLETLFLRSLSSESGWGKALAAIMLEIAPRTVHRHALPASTVAEHMATLLSLAAGPMDNTLRSSQRSQLKRLRQEMRDDLSNFSLNPTELAHRNGISARTLYALFAASGTSFMDDLIKMRLERARSILEDRRFNAKTIAEIAHFVGFLNAHHFSSRFHKAYGMPPGAYRAIKGKA